MAGQNGQRVQEADAILARLAHAHDAAATHIDARIADIFQRHQPVVEGPGGDDLLIMFGRGVDIVVVIIEAGVGQHVRLAFAQHPQRHAGFHAHLAHALHHLDDGGHVPILGIAPGRAHAKARAARILRLRRRLHHRLHAHQLFGLEAAFGMSGLVAIAAILRAAAGLDRQQSGQLHLIAREVGAMDRLRIEHQVVERQVEQRSDFGAGPVGARGSPFPFGSSLSRTLCIRSRQARTERRWGFGAIHHAASSSGGMLWPRRRSTSAAHSTTLEPGP